MTLYHKRDIEKLWKIAWIGSIGFVRISCVDGILSVM